MKEMDALVGKLLAHVQVLRAFRESHVQTLDLEDSNVVSVLSGIREMDRLAENGLLVLTIHAQRVLSVQIWHQEERNARNVLQVMLEMEQSVRTLFWDSLMWFLLNQNLSR